MASFVYHLAVSGVAGAGAGMAASSSFGATWEESLSLGILVLGSGFLSDVDSADSHHTHHALNIASALAPALLLSAAGIGSLGPTMVFLCASLSFLLIRVVLREVVRHLSSPRGMFHSVPAALAWAGLVFLSFHELPESMRLMFAGAAGGGYLLHLVLDASVSRVTLSGGAFAPSRYSGFALKLYSESMFANFVCYGALLSLTFFCLRSLGWIEW